jgi:hypothetical protein
VARLPGTHEPKTESSATGRRTRCALMRLHKNANLLLPDAKTPTPPESKPGGHPRRRGCSCIARRLRATRRARAPCAVRGARAARDHAPRGTRHLSGATSQTHAHHSICDLTDRERTTRDQCAHPHATRRGLGRARGTRLRVRPIDKTSAPARRALIAGSLAYARPTRTRVRSTPASRRAARR